MTDNELLLSIHDQIGMHFGVGRGEFLLEPPTNEPKTPKGNFHGWVWPMPIFQRMPPVISDGFYRHEVGEKGKPGYHRQHLGVDVVYKRRKPGDVALPDFTKNYQCPSYAVPMLAMGPGNVWFAGRTVTGWTIQIDHHDWAGFPLVTYYTHLSELFIDPWMEKSGEGRKGGQYVYAGFELGHVGNAPKGDDINHAHVEFWDFSPGVEKGRVNRCLDPAPILEQFGHRVMS